LNNKKFIGCLVFTQPECDIWGCQASCLCLTSSQWCTADTIACYHGNIF